MCETCGCSDQAGVRIIDPAAGHHHHHQPGHHHPHPRGHAPASGPDAEDRTVTLEEKVLAKNDLLAARNRAWLADREILALNLMSSPGSGKTTLLERTVRERRDTVAMSVIEG